MRIQFLKNIFLITIIISLFLPSMSVAQTRRPARPIQKRQVVPKVQIPAQVIVELGKMQPLDPQGKEAENSDAAEEETAPPDNAPLKKILDYWRGKSGTEEEKNLPSAVVGQRILEACLNRPNLFSGYLGILPKNESTYDAMYQLTLNWEGGSHELDTIKTFLMTNSRYFREELLAASKGSGFDGMGLFALAELDWEAAKPLLEKNLQAGNPDSVLMALRVYFMHAKQAGDTSQSEFHLAKARELVMNPLIDPAHRAQALQLTLADKWTGQEEWLLSLLADPVLGGFTSSGTDAQIQRQSSKPSDFAAVASSSAEVAEVKVAQISSSNFSSHNLARYIANLPLVTNLIPKIIKLVGDADLNKHHGAVSFLAASQDTNYSAYAVRKPDKALDYSREIIQALMPWLINKNWARAPGRENFIRMLAGKNLPECLPGLMTIISNETENSSTFGAAVATISTYDTPQIIPFLKGILAQLKTQDNRLVLVETIYGKNGYSDSELVNAVEDSLRYSFAADKLSEKELEKKEAELPTQVMLGRMLITSDNDYSDSFVERVFEEVKRLRQKELEIAQAMMNLVERQKSRSAQLNLIERFRAGEVDSSLLAFALSRRAEFQKQVSNELNQLQADGGYGAGFAAVMLNESGRVKEILTGKDVKAQQALLASARYVRDKLTITEIIPLLSNPTLTAVAESYLEIENSREARQLIWSRHPKQAWIVGESSNDYDDDNDKDRSSTRTKLEKQLQAEVLKADGPEAIYAYLTPANSTNPGVIVRVKKEEAEISLPNSKGFRKKRLLTVAELNELKFLTSQPEVEDLNSEGRRSAEGYYGQFVNEYLRVSNDSSRRILVTSIGRAPKKDATLYEQLVGMFYSMSREGAFKIRYDIEDQIKGVEVVYADEKNPIYNLGIEDNEMRVFARRIENSGRPDDAGNLAQWYVFSGGNFGSMTTAPSHLTESYLVSSELQRIRRGGEPIGRHLSVIPGKQVTYLTKESPVDDAGIYKLVMGGTPEKIISGRFYGLEVTPDENWLVATRENMNPQEGKKNPYTLVRFNLRTKEEYLIQLPGESGAMYPHTHIPGGDKILLTRIPTGIGTKNSYWLEAQTGKVQLATGDLRPLLSKTFMPFQPTLAPRSYWTAFYDLAKGVGTFGVYNVENFTFRSVVELPNLQFSSTNIWADELNGYAYLTHEGNLLRLPLK